jgi:hypothetical protein
MNGIIRVGKRRCLRGTAAHLRERPAAPRKHSLVSTVHRAAARDEQSFAAGPFGAQVKPTPETDHEASGRAHATIAGNPSPCRTVNSLSRHCQETA